MNTPAPDDDGTRESSDPARLVADPVVSVIMTTYNHAAFLAEAIEGVLAQRADFPFELLIGEDASTDATRQIALAYQAKHPDRIRVFHSDGNVGTHANIRRLFARARGELIAFCEGDDYWCAPDKLVAQVALFRADPGIGAVHSDWGRTRLRDGAWEIERGRSAHGRVPLRLLEGELFPTFYFPKLLRTCTKMYRRELLSRCFVTLGLKKYRFNDTVMAAYATSAWRVGYVPRVTAIYRLSPGSALRSGVRARIAHLRSCRDFDDDLRQFFRDRTDFPDGYRWETSVGLFLWAVLARDGATMREALADLRRHFGPVAFVRDGWKSVRMRLPTLTRRR